MRIRPTHLRYQDPHTPISEHFDDVYFNALGGIEESMHVYLEGSGLLSALRERSYPEQVTVGEIGFGVGLNFILTLREFEKLASPEQSLTYLSVEKFPIYLEDLRELYSRFPDLEKHADLLLDQYPILTPGFHTLSFLNGRVKLILLLGDALEMLSRLEAKIDFWYWDGFSPSKNRDAFSVELFQQVARLSSVRAKGASFSAAGWVRRDLEKVGFQITKRAGFGKKRECISAEYHGQAGASGLPPWFSSENLALVKKGQKVAILGAGLAGSAIAQELKSRGIEVTVIDPNGIAQRASSNSVGLFNIQLSKIPNPISRFAQGALTHFIRELKLTPLLRRYGIFKDEVDSETLATSEYPESFYQVREQGVFLPECGLLNPQRLCEYRLKEVPLIQETITSVTRESPSQKLVLKNSDEKVIFTADHVVYALGADFVLPVNQLSHSVLESFTFRAVRGQTIEVKPSPSSAVLSETLMHRGYVTPVCEEISGNQNHCIGATYQAKPVGDNQVELDTQELIAEAKKWPSFQNLDSSALVSHKVGYRLSTADKLPVIGPLVSPEWFNQNYATVFKGNRYETVPSLQVQTGEWIFMGMSSRGITFSSYGAKILASLMCGEPLPVETDLWGHLHSARFLARDLKRKV